MPVTGTGEAPAVDDDVVAVPRRSLAGLRAGVLVVVVAGVSGLLAMGIGQLQQAETNRHLDATDDRLRAVIASEAREAELEQDVRCVGDHLRYAQFIELAEALTAAGATVGTDAHLALTGGTDQQRHDAHALIARLLPEQVQPIIDSYPPPQCDRLAAERELADADPDELAQVVRSR